MSPMGFPLLSHLEYRPNSSLTCKVPVSWPLHLSLTSSTKLSSLHSFSSSHVDLLFIGHVKFVPASGPSHLLLISAAWEVLYPDILFFIHIPVQIRLFHFLYRTHHDLQLNYLPSCSYIYLFIASLSQENVGIMRRSNLCFSQNLG